MAYPIAFNRRGIFGIETVGAPTVGTADVTFNFTPHPYTNAPYNGLLIVNITQAIPSGTTQSLPIIFNTNGVTQAVTKEGGVPLTVADLSTGYYLFFYDRNTNVLQSLGSISAS